MFSNRLREKRTLARFLLVIAQAGPYRTRPELTGDQHERTTQHKTPAG